MDDRAALLFGTVTAATTEQVTVDVDGSTLVLPWPAMVAASVDQPLWLIVSGRRVAIAGQTGPSVYDNPRGYSAPIRYDGE